MIAQCIKCGNHEWNKKAEGKKLDEVVEEVKEWIAEKMRGVSNAI